MNSELPAEFLSRHQKWYRASCQPIVDELYRRQLMQARALYLQEHKNLINSELPVGDREAREYVLAWLGYLGVIEHRPARNPEAFKSTLALMSSPATTPEGEYFRKRYQLCMLCWGDSHGLVELSPEELKNQLAQAPELATDFHTWHYIGGWAYRHRDLEQISRAFEVTLMHPAADLSQARWQRINIMMLLIEERATKLDVLKTIESLVVLPQIEEFEEVILPDCQRQGLVDTEVEEAYAAMLGKFDRKQPSAPGLERRTKSIRNRP